MRQVPSQPQYAIIGDGRVARHFCHYLSLLDIPYLQWSRSCGAKLAEIVGPCPTVFLLISDAAIEPFIQQQDCLAYKSCVHFSGSLVTDFAVGAHPLMTFGVDLYSLSEYQKIPWIIESESPSFSELFPGLSNPHFVIDKDQKAYYHALCVMSNNFTTLLWQKFFNSMYKEFDIPKEHLIPILQRSMSNIIDDHEAALTGPLMRGDQVTINENLAALSDDAFFDVYQAFVRAYKKEK